MSGSKPPSKPPSAPPPVAEPPRTKSRELSAVNAAVKEVFRTEADAFAEKVAPSMDAQVDRMGELLKKVTSNAPAPPPPESEPALETPRLPSVIPKAAAPAAPAPRPRWYCPICRHIAGVCEHDVDADAREPAEIDESTPTKRNLPESDSKPDAEASDVKPR